MSKVGLTSLPWLPATCIPHVTPDVCTLIRGGMVRASGWNGDRQCDVDDWADVVAIAAGWRRTLGLRRDGAVLVAGRAREGACAVEGWSEIIGLSCGDWHSVGLRADGTAVAAGANLRGQCQVGGWTKVTGIAAGYLYTVGVTSDGRVLTAGDVPAAADGVWVEGRGGRSRRELPHCRLTMDGRVLAAGANYDGQCEVGGWRGIVAVAAGSRHTLGLRSDGTVRATGCNDHGQCDVDGWDEVALA